MNQDEIDRRWVRIRRPTIVVGGELVMENLEHHPPTPSDWASTSVPMQLKSNCGTLVIDDFGRQQVPPYRRLVNRWIVPLEKRYDYLNLASGRKIQVPFDQFLWSSRQTLNPAIWSTKPFCDAFLTRSTS